MDILDGFNFIPIFLHSASYRDIQNSIVTPQTSLIPRLHVTTRKVWRHWCRFSFLQAQQLHVYFIALYLWDKGDDVQTTKTLLQCHHTLSSNFAFLMIESGGTKLNSIPKSYGFSPLGALYCGCLRRK